MHSPPWRPATPDDLAAIVTIAGRLHPDLPERPDALAEKLALFPEGCFVLAADGVVGYGLAHPWMLRTIPPLDAFLTALPAHPTCIFIHDVAALPGARGHGAARRYVDLIAAVARRRGIGILALVSVYGTQRVWSQCGFSVSQDAGLARELEPYGNTARYMERPLA